MGTYSSPSWCCPWRPRWPPGGAGQRLCSWATVLSGTATFAMSLALVPTVAVGRRGTASVAALGSWLRVDSLALVFLVATTFLYCLTAVFAVGYAAADRSGGPVYRRRLFAGLNLFAWSMAVAPLVNNLGLLWVAIEVTTVVSALLVAMEGTDGAIEAAWKYILIASLGLGLSLLATAVMYHAGSLVLGSAYDLSYSKLLGAASRFPAGTVRLSYLAGRPRVRHQGRAVPRAHVAPRRPLRGAHAGLRTALRVVAGHIFYAILRFYQLTERSAGAAFARDVLAGFGVATSDLGALYLASQRDLKRLLAYSSIEHMGILAIGVSFASPLAVAGALLHVLAHAAAKGTSFFGAGSVARKLRTKDLERIRGGVGLLPWTGPMLVGGDARAVGHAALRHVPLRAGHRGRRTGRRYGRQHGRAGSRCCTGCAGHAGLPGAVLAHNPEHAVPRASASGDRRARRAMPKGETSKLMVVAMVLGLIGLVVLGVHPPAPLDNLLHGAAAELGALK